MLFQPTSPYPEQTAIDATASNTFSCYLNAEGGTQITEYDLTINDLDGNEIYTTGDTTLSPVLYNKNTLSITVPSTSGMTNGYDYVWNIKLYETNPTIWVTYGTVQATSTTTNVYLRISYLIEAGMYLKIGNQIRLISTYDSDTGLAVVSTAFSTAPSTGAQYNIYTNYVVSDDIYFKARALPVISITTYTATVTNKAFTFTGSYTQSDNVDWKYYTFNLYDSSGELLDTTGEVNTGTISYTFDGFLTGTSYSIELVVETQDGTSVTTGLESFSVLYAITTVFNNQVVAECLMAKDAMQVSWGNPYTNSYTLTGTTSPYYEYLEDTPQTDQTSVSLYSGSELLYEIGNSLGAVIVPYNSTTSFRTRLPISFQGDIISLNNAVDESYYILSYTDGTFYYDINNLYTGSIKIQDGSATWLLGSTYDEYTNYVWDDTQTWNDSLYFYEQTADFLNTHWCEFTLLPTGILLTLIPVSDLNSSTDYTPDTTSTSSGSIPNGYYTLTLYGQQICDYVWVCNKVFSTSEIEATTPIGFEPTWDTYTMLMALYNDNLNAGSIGTITEGVTDWSVYRQIVGDTRLYFVETVDVATTQVIDYNVANQTSYIYHLFPITASTIGGVLKSESTTTDWWNWSLTGILESSDDENIYYADADNIWLFRLNLKSNSIDQNLDITTYEGFTQYSKISKGFRNYMTGSITCLLGDVENVEYINDTVQKQKDFASFVLSTELKVLKDPKGNIWLIDTISNSYSIIDEISQQPTMLNFEWHEIGDLSEISIIES